MNRLTEMNGTKDFNVMICKNEDCDMDEESCPFFIAEDGECEVLQRILDKLAAYEKMLPFNVGDKIWHFSRGGWIDENEISYIELSKEHTHFYCNHYDFYEWDIGRTVFSSKEEAQKALECNNG